MKIALHIQPEAEFDIVEAYAHYEEQWPGLGAEFVLTLDAALEHAVRFPQMNPLVQDDVRRSILRRFPYAAYYVAEPERLVVPAVLHMGQEPDKIARRLSR